MGCWNGTCMISNLPIISGEKIKLVLLRRAIDSKRLFNSSAYVYSHDIFTPSFFPLSGVYNDYGIDEKNCDILSLLVTYYPIESQWFEIECYTLFNPNRYDEDGSKWNEITKDEFDQHYQEVQKRITTVYNHN
jgi:hypothetical protein